MNRYNDLGRCALAAVKTEEFISLRGFTPRHKKWWHIHLSVKALIILNLGLMVVA